jgi:hypothetical protein
MKLTKTKKLTPEETNRRPTDREILRQFCNGNEFHCPDSFQKPKSSKQKF